LGKNAGSFLTFIAIWQASPLSLSLSKDQMTMPAAVAVAAAEGRKEGWKKAAHYSRTSLADCLLHIRMSRAGSEW
jgi:hypothetical protein